MKSLLAAILLACSTPSQGQHPPDVLVIVLDDVATKDLVGLTLPYIQSLKDAGVTFTNCYANPTCAPSRRSLHTGNWWVRGNGPPCAVDAETPPLAETWLPEAMPGYSSAILGKWHLGASQTSGVCAPVSQGYAYGISTGPSNVGDDDCSVNGTDYDFWVRVAGSSSSCTTDTSSQYEPFEVADKLVHNWGLAAQPRLGVVNINLAHTPFHRPPSYLLPAGYPATTTGRQKFEAMIVAYDELIGYMLSALDLDTTLVVVVGDNGTPPGVAGLESAKAKGTTFERGVKVPLIMAGAGVTDPGRTESGLCHVADIFATAVAVAGGSQASDGISLTPALAHLPQTYHDMVLVGCRWPVDDGDVASVDAAGHKLRWLDHNNDGTADVEQFYDLSTDPSENTNLISDPTYATLIATHRTWLQAHLP